MHHSGRLSSDDDKQQNILIDEEDITAVGEQQPPRSSMQRGNEYQLAAHELTFCKKNIDSFKIRSEQSVRRGMAYKKGIYL